MADAVFTDMIKSLTDKIANLGLSDIVPIFNGEKATFKPWLRKLEKAALVNGLAPEQKKILAYRFSSDAASDYIFRLIDENPDMEFDDFKNELNHRFSEREHPYNSFTKLSTVRQFRNESIENFSERLGRLAEEAYRGFDGVGLMDCQTVGIFIDGLSDESIRMKLIRDGPGTLQQAVTIAVNEQNVRNMCKVRGRASENVTSDNRDNKEPKFPRNMTRDTQRYNNQRSSSFSEMDIDHIRPGNRVCSFCNRKGHVFRDCYKRKSQINEIAGELNRQNSYQGRVSPTAQRVVCYFCSRVGHYKRDCREWAKFRQNMQADYTRNTRYNMPKN